MPDNIKEIFSKNLNYFMEKTGIRQALITGGVAASDLLRQMLDERRKKTRNCPEVIFGKPEMSGDNAVGTALIGIKKYSEGTYGG